MSDKLKQMYHGQFQKHEPASLVEQDIEPYVQSDDGPTVAPQVVHAALQRSVAKLCFHAGFEECQPSALDAFTELAGDFFTKLATSLAGYMEAPRTAVQVPSPGNAGKTEIVWKPRFSVEETVLHSLQDRGCDLESLDAYVSEEIDRTGSRVATMHERMKAHLADLLRPALTDAGPDGSNAFNDGSEQFVGGDFAEELGEDFFGFKELGLDSEFNMASLSVPLHLLQNRMHSANQAQNPRYVDWYEARMYFPADDIVVRWPPTPRRFFPTRSPCLLSPSRMSSRRLVLFRTSTLQSCTPTVMHRWSRMMTYHKSNDFQNRDYLQLVRSAAPGSARLKSLVRVRDIRGRR